MTLVCFIAWRAQEHQKRQSPVFILVAARVSKDQVPFIYLSSQETNPSRPGRMSMSHLARRQNKHCLNCTPTCSVAMFPSEVYVLWRSTKEVNMLCPTRFVVDAAENSNEGGVTEVRSSHTGL